MYAQDLKLTPKDTAYYTGIARTVILSDNFDDDRNGWIGVLHPPATVFIKGGIFYLKKGTESSWGIDLIIDYSREFEIEFAAKLENKSILGDAMLMWGSDCDIDGETVFYFNKSALHMTTYVAGEWKDMRRYHKSLPATEWYTYRIRKVGKEYHVFVNGNYVFSYPYTKLNGRRIAFQGRRVNVMVDDIRISYLN